MKHKLKRENNFQNMICPENENKRLDEFFVSLLRVLKRFPDKESVTVYKDDHFYRAFIWLAEKHGKTGMKDRMEKLMDHGFYIGKTNKTRAWQRA